MVVGWGGWMDGGVDGWMEVELERFGKRNTNLRYVQLIHVAPTTRTCFQSSINAITTYHMGGGQERKVRTTREHEKIKIKKKRCDAVGCDIVFR